MFRQTPRIEDISHGGVWPRRRMTDISGKVNWLCVFCLLSAGHLSSAALISGAGHEVESRLTWQACCLALLLGVLCLTGTHLFKVAAQTYYAPPVTSAPPCADAAVCPAGPCWSIFAPDAPPR